jgi:Ca2+-binding RTX toxin-like protein
MIRPFLLAIAALAIAAPAASAHDAEIFATNNTAVITDPADPRLDDPLVGFERDVSRLIEAGGGRVRSSDLLDGVFASDGTTTFERSRVFAVDGVEPDAVELDVPGVDAGELRAGLLADTEAQTRLSGGSVTQADHLRLVAAREDQAFALDFARRIGGDTARTKVSFGEREFVEGPLPVRVEQRTLVIDGTPDNDVITVAFEGGKVRVGEATFARSRFDRIRADLGDGLDTLTFNGGGRVDVDAHGDRVRLTRNDLPADLDGADIVGVHTGDGADTLHVGDLSATDTFQVAANLGAGADRATVDGSEDDDQISLGAFGVLGPTFVSFEQPELADRLTIDGRGGDDIISASVASMRLTLAGGSGDNVLRGGPGDDTLIGGNGFDDAVGGPGHDVARLGADFDRFSWRPGDGSDEIDGGGSRDSVFVEGSNAAEAFALKAEKGGLRLTRGTDVLRLDALEEVDAVAGGGADTFSVGDLRHSEAQLVDISLAGLPITPLGDTAADRVSVDATPGRDALTLTGKGTTATLTGLSAKVNISHAEGALDTLAIDTRAGRDTIDTTGFAPATIGLEVQD